VALAVAVVTALAVPLVILVVIPVAVAELLILAVPVGLILGVVVSLVASRGTKARRLGVWAILLTVVVAVTYAAIIVVWFATLESDPFQ